jgi:hypothetical protein
MKKVIIIAVSCLVLISACGFGIYKYKEYKDDQRTYTKTFEVVLKVKYSDVDKILLRGTYGSFAVIKDKKSVQEIIDEIKGIKLKLISAGEPRIGWRYSLELYHSSKALGGFSYIDDTVKTGADNTEYTFKSNHHVDNKAINSHGKWYSSGELNKLDELLK